MNSQVGRFPLIPLVEKWLEPDLQKGRHTVMNGTFLVSDNYNIEPTPAEYDRPIGTKTGFLLPHGKPTGAEEATN